MIILRAFMSGADHNRDDFEAKKRPEKPLLPSMPYGSVEIRDVTNITKGRLRLVYREERDFRVKLEEITDNLKKLFHRRSLSMAEYVAINGYIQKRLKEILRAFDMFSDIPDEFIRKNGNQRILNAAKDKTLRGILKILRADEFSVKMDGSNFYTWEKACSVLEVVALSLKGKEA